MRSASFSELPKSILFPFLTIFSFHALANNAKHVFFPWQCGLFHSFSKVSPPLLACGYLQTSTAKDMAFSLPLFRLFIRQLLRLTACLSSCLLLNLKQTTLKHLKNKKCKKWVMPASSGPVPSPEWLAFTCQLVHPVFSWALGSEGKQTVGHPRSSPSGSHWLYKRFAFPFSLHPCGAEIDAESVCGWCEGSLLLPASRK